VSRRKGWVKRLGDDIGWVLMRMSESLVKSRGAGYAVRFGTGIGRVLWPLMVGRRRQAMRNAAVALPDRTVAERRAAVDAAVVDNVAHVPEIFAYAYNGTRRTLDNVRVEGREHLDAALARGKGVVAVSIHLGNFAIIGTWMSEAGYEFYFLTRYPHDPRIVRRFVHLRQHRLKMGAIRDRPRRACINGLMRAFERNAIVFIQLDQHGGETSVEVPFFGRPFDAFTGPVALALKTGAAVVPMYIYRERGIKHRLVIEPEFDLTRTGDKRADVAANLGRLMEHFEGWIRRHPDQWWWVSRIWRGV
jgi:KDO2-lipid IV(A) lauroyltransferase